MTNIPKNRIIKQNNYGDIGGDIVESFNLDLTSNYGAARVTRTKKVIDSDDVSDIRLPVAFAFYNDVFWFASNDFVYKGGASPSNQFTLQNVGGTPSDVTEALSDMEVFNNCLYVSQGTSIAKLNNTTWSTAVSTQLTAARPHLLKSFGSGDNARLYITDEYYKIHSINTSDAIAVTGSFTMDFKLGDDWTITMLEAAENALWVGLLNTNDGTGAVYEWDGATENVWNRRFILESGVMSGVVLNDVPYIMDARGKLMKFNGAGFAEEDRLANLSQYSMKGAFDGTNLRYIHPNGMTVTDYGSILIAVSNDITNQLGYINNVPSGIYEYQPGIGLYHKYSVSSSEVDSLSIEDYGQHRVAQMGAVYFRRPITSNNSSNGTLLFGAEYIISQTSNTSVVTKRGVFCDDALDTTPKMGYIKTGKIFSESITDNWNKIYAVYKEMFEQSDKIVVKYRTREKNSRPVDFIWLNNTQITTIEDVTDLNEHDEILITTGTGAGESFIIDSVERNGGVSTVTVKENTFNKTEPFTGVVSNFRLLGEMNKSQFQALTISMDNNSPWIQFLIKMYFTGKKELHKLKVISKAAIKE